MKEDEKTTKEERPQESTSELKAFKRKKRERDGEIFKVNKGEKDSG